ncbi:hypothetical protein J2X68_007558 [Streptomyces sp. 3330]|uniref:peptidase n=1 Tax=Streptomyces sp. 3330 TaxID=2817755 RepID=UPI00285ECDAC|nr:peptidase [Streptomyces sp. 3330]MDR6980816.1 hypothetical protein [Streptomyces sp. 3330]
MPPPCCTDPFASGVVHDPVGLVTQYATWDLIGPIAYEGYDPVNDPGWEKTGAPSPAFYARWCRHLCGIACLRMVLLHRDGRAPDMFTLLTGARNAGAYVREADGTVKGLIYAPFVEYTAHTHRLPAAVHGDLDLDGLVALLDAGHMVMASVSKEIRRPEHKPERRGAAGTWYWPSAAGAGRSSSVSPPCPWTASAPSSAAGASRWIHAAPYGARLTRAPGAAR